jgi:hypothetical protein
MLTSRITHPPAYRRAADVQHRRIAQWPLEGHFDQHSSIANRRQEKAHAAGSQLIAGGEPTGWASKSAGATSESEAAAEPRMNFRRSIPSIEIIAISAPAH